VSAGAEGGAVLTEHTRAEIDRWLGKFPADRRRSAAIAALREVQHQNHGYLTVPLMDAVAEYIGLPAIQVYEVASFYTMYNTKPTGKYKLTICTCLPCGLQGALDAADHLRERLDIDFNETTPDGKFTLKEGECMGACGDAPVLVVNDRRMCSWMNPAQLDELVGELKAAAERGEGNPVHKGDGE